MPIQKYSASNITAGTLGMLAVSLSVIGRLSLVDQSRGNIPNLFFTSFLRGMSKATSDGDVLDPHTLDPHTMSVAENVAASDRFSIKQMKKDFEDAYKLQEDKFAKGKAALKETTDRAKDFLYLPKKEMLALDRSARAFLLREFEDLKAEEILQTIDTLGHYYSASVSVLLANMYRVGEVCGYFVGKSLKSLHTEVSNSIKLYFVSYVIGAEILSSPLGKTLGFDKIAKKIYISSRRLYTPKNYIASNNG